MSARLAALVLAALAIPAAGCSYNPAVFPYVLPPGPIQQTHAKPRGLGYFRDFDPKACRIEVKPSGQANAPLGAQIVLVASVLDKEGQPRRDRRVEWMIEGPGNIIEADESGLYAGRGYKVDNKYAVTYTSYIPKKMTRGNDDPKDDVAIEPGQTFVVISSAIPGETVVTAYAPEVYNWDNGRVITKIVWGDSRFSFPASTTARIGGETTLSTTVTPSATDPQSAFRVRYRVVDGPAAVLVSKSGADTGTSLAGSGGAEAEAVTDESGAAAVRLVQHDPKPGRTRIAVEVLKAPDTGTGPGTVVGRRDVTVEWAKAELKLRVNAPQSASPNAPFPVTVALDNTTGVESKDARVRVTLSDGAVMGSSDPPPTKQDEKGALLFDLPPVNGKGKQAVTLQVRPAKLGSVTVTAEAVTGDGMQANTQAVTRIEQGKLQLHLEAPTVGLAGERIPVRISVTNGGTTPAEHVTVWADFDAGLTSASGANPIEIAGGTIAPGHTQTFDLPLAGKATGRYGVRATATGDGKLSAKADPIAVEVRRAELAVALNGPKIAYIGQGADWTLTVVNRGEATLSNATARVTVPAELNVTTAAGGTLSTGLVEWKLGDLRAGEQKAFKFSGETSKIAAQVVVSAVVSGDVVNNGATVGAPIEGKAEAALAVIGAPALALELATPPGIVEVGKRVRYQIRVKNEGTVSAQKIDVTAFAPPELKAVRGSGGTADARIDGTGRITFPTVEELQPGQTLTLTVEVDAAQVGDARFKVEVAAAHIKNTLKEEQSTRITGK